ncbi:MAG: transglycosylase domain-containing protein, partial [Myxococcota bacterium]|nr:transglycosylase domain-containing protein [Myxococcota bacterium]MDW8364166.1 peptide chain release factor-like protein [Myxococcales bacterium]
FGNRAYGVVAAADFYYGKTLEELSIAEAAMLAAIPKFPSTGNPLANRERALKMLKAKLYELELAKREAEKRRLEESKADIGWGSQIRNYVLDQSRIKDLRTGLERSDTQRVLDGDLDPFIEAALKMGLEAGARRPDAA